MTTQSPKRLIGLVVALGIALALLVWQFSQLPQFQIPAYDFHEYWSAGRLCAEGQNPYSDPLMKDRQEQIGRDSKHVMMWNPPWTLSFVIPFGLLPVHVSQLLWLAIGFLMMMLSAFLLWQVYEGRSTTVWLCWALLLTFAPALIALTAGQISPWLLLGATLFLVCVQRQWWILAGAASVLLAIKPHLSYLFWIALLLWCVQQRQWKLILGGIMTGLLCLLIPMILYPPVLQSYFDAIANRPPAEYDSPTLGTVIRQFFDKDNFSLQYLSIIPGILWLIPYWLKHRHQWVWRERLPMLLIVSMLTAAYGAWPFDVVMLLVAVMEIATLLDQSGKRSLQLSGVIFYALMNALAGVVLILNLGYFSFIWLTPTLLIGYVVFKKRQPF